jgi:catechol 2,3-dioxygenase
MGIMRMGYAHVRVTDLAEAKDHYANTMGLYQTLEQDGRVYYKGWDEWDHHSVVIEEGGVGVVKFGFKVEYESDLDDIEKKAKQFGLTVERMSAGENPEVSDGIRFITPSEHVIEVYHGQTLIGTEVGTHNPDSFPRHLVGVGVPALDHALIFADDVRLMENMFREVFDYFPTERVQTDLNDDDAHFIASWMTSNNQIHQIAVLEGEQAKLHHFAFKLQDWAEVGRAADIMTMDDVPIDIGPTRHGITRATRSLQAATRPTATGR